MPPLGIARANFHTVFRTRIMVGGRSHRHIPDRDTGSFLSISDSYAYTDRRFVFDCLRSRFRQAIILKRPVFLPIRIPRKTIQLAGTLELRAINEDNA